jgi:hypothetical protein
VSIRPTQAAAVLITLMLAFSCAAEQPFVALHDTGAAADSALTGEAVAKKDGWAKIAEGQKSAIKGCAVLSNKKLAVVLRPKASGVELYGIGANGAKLRSLAAPVADGSALTLDAVSVVSVDSSNASVEATFKSAKGGSFKVAYSLGAENPILATKPGAGVLAQRIEAPSRLGVMPDFFADDIVIDAKAIPAERAEIPGDNFFMNMLDGGSSIVTTIWDRNSKDPELTFSGAAEARVIRDVTVWYGKEGSVWVAALEGANLWGQAELTAENVKAASKLSWQPPFSAKWKGGFTRTDRTVDSWMFDFNPKNLRHWSGVVGGYQWPCWVEGKGADAKAMILPPTKFPNGTFAGAFVVYPIDRAAEAVWHEASAEGETPLDQLTIADLMRNSMGIGPCQHIMDVAGQGVSDKGIYTCSVDHTMPMIFAKGWNKNERVYLENMLNQMTIFVRAIEARVNSFVDFRADLLKYLGEQKKARPELAAFIGRLEAQTGRIQPNKLAGSKPISDMTAKLRAAILADEPPFQINAVTNQLAEGVAEGQDNAAAKCRQAVKILRQMATMEMTLDPKAVELAREIRTRTQKMLSGASGHEQR